MERRSMSKTTKKTEKVATAAKKAPAKKTPVKKTAEKPAAKKVAEKPVAKKFAEKPVAKKAVAKPVAAKKVAEKPVAKKAAAKPAAAKKAAEKPAAKKAPAKKTVVKISAPAKKAEAVPARAAKKLKLTKAQKKHYIDVLMKLRTEYMSQLRYHQDEALASKKDAAGERAGMATHMADLGSDNFRHDLELGLLSGEGDVILMIDEALQKIKDSEYGICIECGCEISPGRLEAKPYARFCTKCKAMYEQMEDPSRRHR